MLQSPLWHHMELKHSSAQLNSARRQCINGNTERSPIAFQSIQVCCALQAMPPCCQAGLEFRSGCPGLVTIACGSMPAASCKPLSFDPAGIGMPAGRCHRSSGGSKTPPWDLRDTLAEAQLTSMAHDRVSPIGTLTTARLCCKRSILRGPETQLLRVCGNHSRGKAIAQTVGLAPGAQAPRPNPLLCTSFSPARTLAEACGTFRHVLIHFSNQLHLSPYRLGPHLCRFGRSDQSSHAVARVSGIAVGLCWCMWL